MRNSDTLISDHTALYECACWYGQVGAVEFLLKHNADPNIPYKKGPCPLDMASSDVVRDLLLRAGADRSLTGVSLTASV